MLGDITAKLALDVGEIVYNKKTVRNAVLELDARGGAVAVPKLSATLPGDMVLQAKSTMTGDAAKPRVTGEFSLVGPKLRETLGWLEVDTSSVPATKLQKLSLKGRMASSGGNVQVSDAVFELDDLKGNGGRRGDVRCAAVDRDQPQHRHARPRFVPRACRGTEAGSIGIPGGDTACGIGPAGRRWPLDRSEGQGGQARLQQGDDPGVDVDLALQGSTLRLNDVKVSNIGGGRLAVRGTVANYSAPQPRPDIAFNFEAPTWAAYSRS